MSSEKKTYILTGSGRMPYSNGYMAQTLITLGLPQDRAYRDAYAISIMVDDQNKDEMTSDEIMILTQKWYEERDPVFAKRIPHIRQKFKPFRPMVILLGGVTGIGKSTIAQQLGSNFGIRAIMGTDLIREVLRVTISRNLMPTLHESSYRAHRSLDTSFLPATSRAVLGFETQARQVTVGIESAIEQAIQDNEILIIEGVHLIPGIIKQKIIDNKAVAFFMLTLQNEDIHISRLKNREAKVESRSENYLKYIINMRKIQDYLMEQANKNNVKIIDIENDEKALLEIINSVWDWKIAQLEKMNNLKTTYVEETTIDQN